MHESCILLPLIALWYLLRALLLTAVGAIKGAIVFVPVALIVVPSWTAIAVLCWPHDILMTYYTVCVTPVRAPCKHAAPRLTHFFLTKNIAVAPKALNCVHLLQLTCRGLDQTLRPFCCFCSHCRC